MHHIINRTINFRKNSFVLCIGTFQLQRLRQHQCKRGASNQIRGDNIYIVETNRSIINILFCKTRLYGRRCKITFLTITNRWKKNVSEIQKNAGFRFSDPTQLFLGYSCKCMFLLFFGCGSTVETCKQHANIASNPGSVLHVN